MTDQETPRRCDRCFFFVPLGGTGTGGLCFVDPRVYVGNDGDGFAMWGHPEQEADEWCREFELRLPGTEPEGD